MSTLTITQALVNWFSEPVTNLPRELRPIAEAYISQWSSLSPDERRARAKEVDRQRVVKAGIKLSLAEFQQERDRHVPLKFAEETIGFWDGQSAMSASFWWDQPAVTAHHAALILCQYNPSNLNGAKPEKDSDETGRVMYAQLLSSFDAMELVTPGHRALSEWLKYARCRGLKYHTWIDEYLSAVNTLRLEQGPETSSSAALMEPPNPSVTSAALAGETLLVSRTAETSQASTTSVGNMDWALQKPSRYQGYRRPLYLVLKEAHDAGLAQPTARDVLDAFKLKLKLPSEIIEVMHDGLNYYDTLGNSKSASLRDISKTITRLVAQTPD